jgi:hypothetical protein
MRHSTVAEFSIGKVASGLRYVLELSAHPARSPSSPHPTRGRAPAQTCTLPSLANSENPFDMFRLAARSALPRNSIQARFASTKARNVGPRVKGKILTLGQQTLKETLKEVIPAKQEQLKKLVSSRFAHSAKRLIDLYAESRSWASYSRRDQGSSCYRIFTLTATDIVYLRSNILLVACVA